MTSNLSGRIARIFSVFCLAAVFFTAIVARIYTGAAEYFRDGEIERKSGYHGETEDKTTAVKPLDPPRLPSVPPYDDGNSNVAVGNINSNRSYNSGYNSNENTHVNTPRTANANITNTNINSSSRFNGRVIKDGVYLWTTWQPTDDYLEELQTGDLITIIRQSVDDKTMFYVETKSGNKGWIQGNDIEYRKQ